MRKAQVLVTVSILVALVASMSFVSASTSSFSDHFTDPTYADKWVSTGVAPTGMGSSIITLTANSTLTSKPMFHHGVLTMSVSVTTPTLTSTLWGWATQGGSSVNFGAFFYYNVTGVYAVIGNATDPANQQIAAIPAFDMHGYAEYMIEWNYTSGYSPYFTFHVNGGTYTLTPTGSLQKLDSLSFPIVFAVKGSSSAAKLNVDYTGVSDSVVTVQSTITVTTTSTTTIPVTHISATVTVYVDTTELRTSTSTVSTDITETSVNWISTAKTYTVNSTLLYTSYNPIQVNVTHTETSHTNTTEITTTTSTNTIAVDWQNPITTYSLVAVAAIAIIGVVVFLVKGRMGGGM